MSDDRNLIERLSGTPVTRWKLAELDALLALARKGVETERLRDLLERARYQLPGGLLGDEPNTLIDEIESALAPKEPNDG